ncbi:hypothetical protein [Mycolicibacterium sp. J2]|uniref:hypothetical protein n=1 Tax=Mycolicibacterium sp. J2 TaxID=2993511 RepID=UPI00224AE60C|nr:hypothetical protein [Mycolicibacterium sp. J2]MCX2710951.1 hypothetical protein [Mycolicibacterium sp. J2]
MSVIDTDLDDLFRTPPERFTARRKELVAAARKRGDPDGARTVGAARRPTTAAWLVNLLVLTDPTVRPRLAELHQALRAAHADMDGPRIRELSKKQRGLVHELTAAALAATGQAHPTSALREEVSGTLQAAVADPDVTARLGRLTKAETWSGFGDFGTSSAVTARAAATKRTAAAKQPASGEPQDRPEIGRALHRRDTATAAVNEARGAHADAVAAAEEHLDKLAAARSRLAEVQAALASAERDVVAAQREYDHAQRRVDTARHTLETAETALRQADSELARLNEG